MVFDLSLDKDSVTRDRGFQLLSIKQKPTLTFLEV